MTALHQGVYPRDLITKGHPVKPNLGNGTKHQPMVSNIDLGQCNWPN